MKVTGVLYEEKFSLQEGDGLLSKLWCHTVMNREVTKVTAQLFKSFVDHQEMLKDKKTSERLLKHVTEVFPGWKLSCLAKSWDGGGGVL